MGGIYALVPTPYNNKGEFNEKVFRENIKKVCKAGIHGIVTTGTLGEFNTISWEEHQRLIVALKDETSKYNTTSIAGCSGVNTREAIKKTKFAEENGIDAVMNVVPFYQILNRDEVVEYYSNLACACPNIGIIVYNNPFTGRVLHNAETFKRLSKIPNIIGSKETTADFVHWMELVKIKELSFMHIDHVFVPSMMWGGKGCFSFSACLKPDLILQAYHACIEKDWEKAMDLQYKINDLLFINNLGDYIMRPAGDPSLFKPMIEAAGFLKTGNPGKPYLPISDKLKKSLEKQMKEKLLKT